MAATAVPIKKQVEDVVRGTNLGDLNPAWIDDIVDWVQSKLVHSNDSSETSEPSTPSDSPSTPSSDYSDPPDWIPTAKPFQATVEDDTSSTKDSHVGSLDNDRPSSNTSRRRPPQLGQSPQRRSPQPSTTSSNDASFTTARPGLSQRTPSLAGNGCLPSPPSSTSGSPRLRPTVHFSERAPPKLSNRTPARPDAAAKASASPALSVVDLQWGRLFTGGGEPTTRLRQVLRGLANYIIAEFEPAHSLVMTPGKLFAFYKICQLDKELYPFQSIFDCHSSKKPLRSLELLYQDLRCEYHLVQGGSRDRPYIPALTPDGFANWMAVFIQASPDLEARRLDKIMASLPVEAESNTLDGKPERLPKQLSRHLFPSKPHERTRQRVANALVDWTEAMGLAESRPSSWTAVFCDAICRSLSPTPRDRGRKCTRGDRDYIEVIEAPTAQHLKSHHRPVRSCQRTRDHDEHAVRQYATKALVEEAGPRRSRDASPKRHRQHRQRSPRPLGRHRHAQAHHRGGAPGPQATPPSSRESSPNKLGPKRADNYALFQGRELGPGPTYDEFLRETSAAKRTQRGARHGG